MSGIFSGPCSEEKPHDIEPAFLLTEYAGLLVAGGKIGPVLDLAGGEGRNAVFLARLGLDVVLVDRSSDALAVARKAARKAGVTIRFLQVDLEREGENPLSGMVFGAVIVFRYLHRPLIPAVRNWILPGGLLVYETYTIEHATIGRPRNPDFLLRPGELLGWFSDWEILHWFEGLLGSPERAVARIVCRKPSQGV